MAAGEVGGPAGRGDRQVDLRAARGARQAGLAVAKKLRHRAAEPAEQRPAGLAERDGTRRDQHQFDQIYIDRLRAAHGKIFPAIATIRASTRNDTVRKLAQQANQFVMTHMTLLESSGIVDYGALPTAPRAGGGRRGPAVDTAR